MKKSRIKLVAGIVSMAALFTAVSMGQVKTENVAANATQQLAGVNTGLTDQQLREKAVSIIPGTIVKAEYDYDNGQRIIEFDIIDKNGIKRELSLYTATGKVEEIDYDYDAQGNRFIRQDLFTVNKTFEQSQQIALTRIPGTVLATKQESEHGLFIHKFFIQANAGGYYIVKVETQNGTITKIERKDHFDRSEYFLPPVNVQNQTVTQPTQNQTTTPPVTTQPTPAPAPTPQVTQPTGAFTEAKARQIALGAVPGTVLRVEYDYDDGRPEYEYKIKKSDGTVWEVKVVYPGWVDDIDYKGRYVNGVYYKD